MPNYQAPLMNLQPLPNLNNTGMMGINQVIPQLVPQNLIQRNQRNDEEGLEIVEELQEKMKILNEDYELEVKNNKMLEDKCEEYLNQLQRSADIIESSKEKNKAQLEVLDERIQTMEEIALEEKKRNESLIFENDRLRAELVNLRSMQNGDHSALGRLQKENDNKSQAIAELRGKVE